MGDHHRNEQRQHAVTQPRQGTGIGKTVFAPFAARPRSDVLKDAQRADHRTVDPSEQQRQHQERRNDGDIDRLNSVQQLHSGHPSEPRMQRPREIEEEQRNHRKENGRGRDSDFSQHLV